jgi:carbon storage regulator CsrA
MLVLTRRAGESVYLGDDIKVTAVRVRGGQVRLAIEAPGSVPVVREELCRSRATTRKSFSESPSRSAVN